MYITVKRVRDTFRWIGRIKYTNKIKRRWFSVFRWYKMLAIWIMNIAAYINAANSYTIMPIARWAVFHRPTSASMPMIRLTRINIYTFESAFAVSFWMLQIYLDMKMIANIMLRNKLIVFLIFEMMNALQSNRAAFGLTFGAFDPVSWHLAIWKICLSLSHQQPDINNTFATHSYTERSTYTNTYDKTQNYDQITY